MTDRQANAIAAAISDTTPIIPEVAKLRAIAIASVFQIIFNHAGRRTHEGHTQNEIADELHPIIETVLDELDRWLSLPQPRAAYRREHALATRVTGVLRRALVTGAELARGSRRALAGGGGVADWGAVG